MQQMSSVQFQAMESDILELRDDCFRQAIQDQEGRQHGQIDIRGGMLDNMAVVLEPAIKALEKLDDRSIFQLAREGDTSSVINILTRIGPPKSSRVLAKLNLLDDTKVGLLHYAARYERLELVKALVFWGADVNIRGDDGLAPLHFAARFKILQKISQATLKSVAEQQNYASKAYQYGSSETIDIKDIMGKSTTFTVEEMASFADIQNFPPAKL